MEEQKLLERNVQTLTEERNQLDVLLQRHLCTKKNRFPLTSATANPLSITKTDIKTIPTATLLDPNNNGNSKQVTINIANAQDLFSVGSIPRVTQTLTTTNGVSSASTAAVPMITIHILPEVAQALLGSTTFDQAKLAALLQQTNSGMTNKPTATINDSSSVVAHPSDSMVTHPDTSTNSTS